MWHELNLEQMAEEEYAESPPCSIEEIEQIVVMTRLELYNNGRLCGAAALQKRLQEFYHLEPLPSVRTIGRILARQGLTYGRTGWYPGEELDSEFAGGRHGRTVRFTDLNTQERR